MINFLDFLVVVGMFLLRFGVPIAITVGLVYLLKRLDRRWEEEARLEESARRATEKPAERPAVPQPTERPVTPKRAPTPAPAIPFVPPPVVTERPQPGLMATQVAQRCWDVKGCSPNQLEKCAAPKHPDQPCWQARLTAEGQIPEECVNCDIFQRYPLM